ncbi:unnamed protein product [Alternaria alternata]
MHRRHKVKQADYPAILPVDSPSSVRGTLVQGLTDGDIWRLDIFEGSEYQRQKVRVKVLQPRGQGSNTEEGMGDLSQREEDNVEGEEAEAETYVWIAGAQRLEPEEWDFAEFVRDKMKRWVGREAAETDEGFQEVDDAVAALDDPTGGRGANGSISRQLTEQGKEDKILESAV